jgi:long-chain acyl-CoA synthetase
MKARKFMSRFDSHYKAEAAIQWAETSPVKTIPALFRNSLEKGAGPRRFVGAKVDGVYRYETYSQIQTKVHHFASALIEIGFQPNDRAALISNNRPEWVVVDLGIMHAGGIHAPLYPTIAAEAIEYILNDSQARLICCATPTHLKAILSQEAKLESLEHIVTLFKHDSPSSQKKLWTLEDFLAHGAANLEKNAPEMEKRIAAIQPTDVCSLVYTSGTTGEPKGAMLMHANFVSNALSSVPVLGYNVDDVELSFLPLSHVFERVAYYCTTSVGATIAYAESIDTVAANMKEVRPTVVPSVPRLFEKIHAKVLDGVKKGGGVKQKLFGWALGCGKAYQDAKNKGQVSGWTKLQYEMARKLVLQKLHDGTGGRIRLFCSGGAPLRKDVGDFFLSAGFNIIEGYGLTETSPVLTINPPARPKIGTVGKQIASTEIKIAEDGEILARGPQIMLGYFNKPQATVDAINPEGWFHTGDIGRFDEDGYLQITDRKKDLLVMSNGKNVAPQPIEQLIQSSPIIEQCVVLGDNRKFIGALVVPTWATLVQWATSQGISGSNEELAKNPKVVEYLSKEVASCCANLSAYERVKKIAVLPRELTLDAGELTPTLKVKRKVVNQNFAEQIASVYEGGDGE